MKVTTSWLVFVHFRNQDKTSPRSINAVSSLYQFQVFIMYAVFLKFCLTFLDEALVSQYVCSPTCKLMAVELRCGHAEQLYVLQYLGKQCIKFPLR